MAEDETARVPQTHSLKTWPEFFTAVQRGDKTFEVRKMDRDFQVGDTLLLHEYNPDFCTPTGEEYRTRGYTGEEERRIITYRLDGGQFGIEEGFCVLGMKEAEKP